MPSHARTLLDTIRQLPITQAVRVINVCGGHERTIAQAGLRSLLPPHIELIPGPGCPVCICPEADIRLAIEIARHEPVIMLAFGDMLRVPINVAAPAPRTLEQAKAQGADIRPIATPTEALNIARTHPQQTVVFFVAGFETTCAPVAALLAEGIPDNLYLLMSGRLTKPTVALLLDTDTPSFDALIAPGHVASIMGADEWRFVSAQHQLPTAIAGFTAEGLLTGLYAVLRQWLEGKPQLDNCYPQVVKAQGNRLAQQLLQTQFQQLDAPWRGIGNIPASGFELSVQNAAHDARQRYSAYIMHADDPIGPMPPGCACASVVMGHTKPNGCALYGKPCTPQHPIGPCMVSDEGACRIWWSAGISRP